MKTLIKALQNRLLNIHNSILCKSSYPTLTYTDISFSSRQVSQPTKLMIVSHPDDESLFGGEALITSNDWTVVCVTNASNAERREEFFKAMKYVGANYTILDHEDNLSNGQFHPHLLFSLTQLINEFPYKTIVTHNRKGEYGHPQHRALHRIVLSLAKGHIFLVFGKHKGVACMSDEKQKLLNFYPSQQNDIKRYRHFAEREILIKVHT